MSEPKHPVYTDIVPNPLHQFASYTYALSLWWMHPSDYNELMTKPDVTDALAYDLVSQATRSYVIAEDCGLYPNRRHPATGGLNYNLQNLEITTFVAPSPTTGCTNKAFGKFTIIEPCGVTLINVLASAAYSESENKYLNYLEQNYILQVDFTGYNDAGEAIPLDQTALYRKRFPIRISKMELEISSKGSEYHCEFLPAGHLLYQSKDAATTPKNFQIVASTIEEFFSGDSGLATQLNAYQRSLVGGSNEWGDLYTFDIDTMIAESTIVNPKEANFVDSDPNSAEYNPTTKTWAIPAGTEIQTIVNKVMSHSSFLIDQLGLQGKKTTPDNQTAIVNLFKMLVSMRHEGLSANSGIAKNVYDHRRNVYAKSYNFTILQIPTWLGSHPAMPQMSDMRSFCTKSYEYLYTGQNIDIINWELKFDHTYYVPVIGFTNQIAAATPSAAIKDETNAQNVPMVNLTASVLTQLIPVLGSVKTATPMSTLSVVNNKNTTIGFGIEKRPAAMIVADTLKTVYADHDSSMMQIKLDIVGDPTMLKQDDWLYVPAPDSADYNWETVPQNVFAGQFGHLRLDAGEIVVSLAVNTPIDLDVDSTNQGLVTPRLGTIPAVFNGFFHITKIYSTFADGKFTQRLEMNRYINSDYVQATAQAVATTRATSFSYDVAARTAANQDYQTFFGTTPPSSSSTIGGTTNIFGR